MTIDRLTMDLAILAKFLRFSIPLLPVFFFSWVIQSSDSYFLAYYLGKDAVGKYIESWVTENFPVTISEN